MRTYSNCFQRLASFSRNRGVDVRFIEKMGKNFIGYGRYDVKNNVIELSNHYKLKENIKEAICALAHEIGHSIDIRRLALNKSEFKKVLMSYRKAFSDKDEYRSLRIYNYKKKIVGSEKRAWVEAEIVLRSLFDDELIERIDFYNKMNIALITYEDLLGV